VHDSDLKRNAVFHVLDGVLFFAGMAIFNVEVVVPAMLSELSDSAFLLGLVPLVSWSGMLLPQILCAKMVEGLERKKRAVILFGIVQRMGHALLLLSLFVHWGAPFTLVAFFVAWTIGSLGTGFIVPVWSDWYARTTPEAMWGRLLGMRRAVFGVLAIVLGPALTYVMGAFPSPARYRILIAIALAFYTLSLCSAMCVREERQPRDEGQTLPAWSDYLGGVLRMLIHEPGFRTLMLGLILTTVPLTLAGAFLAKYGLTHPGVEVGITGTFTLLFYVATSVGALLGGTLSDRCGPMMPFRVLPLLFLGAPVAACLSSHPAMVSVAFGFFGLAMGIRMVALLPAVFRFAPTDRRPTYTAVTFTCLGVANALVPLMMGFLIDAGLLTFRQVFMVCAVLMALGWLLFARLETPERA